MPRITKVMKEAMLTAAIERAFKSEANELVEEREASALKLYAKVFKKDIIDKMYALPPGYVHQDNDLKFMFGGETAIIGFNGWQHSDQYSIPSMFTVADKPQHVYKRMSQDKMHGYAISLPADDPLCIEYEALKNRGTDLSKRIDDARAAAQVALDQCTTIKSLIKAWPEFEPFAKPYDLPDERRLPVVQTSRLNKLLDLPVDEANEALGLKEPA